jgi:hypothetical protein
MKEKMLFSFDRTNRVECRRQFVMLFLNTENKKISLRGQFFRSLDGLFSRDRRASLSWAISGMFG